MKGRRRRRRKKGGGPLPQASGRYYGDVSRYILLLSFCSLGCFDRAPPAQRSLVVPRPPFMRNIKMPSQSRASVQPRPCREGKGPKALCILQNKTRFPDKRGRAARLRSA